MDYSIMSSMISKKILRNWISLLQGHKNTTSQKKTLCSFLSASFYFIFANNFSSALNTAAALEIACTTDSPEEA